MEDVIGTLFDDILVGSEADNLIIPLPGDDAVDRRGGIDAVGYFLSEEGVTVDLGLGSATGEGSDSLAGIEGAWGSIFYGDTLIGDGGLGVFSTRNVFFGFVVAESARSLVRGSSGSGNLAPDGDGMGVFGSHDIRIVDNSFEHNPLGLHVDDSADNVIRGNLFSRNSGFGIFVGGDRNQVRRNRCVRNEACIVLANGNRNVVARNRSRGDLGGIGLDKGRANVVARNVVRGARFQGIYLGIQNPPIGGGDNVVRRNRVRGSDHDGFRVREKDDHSLLRRNIAKRNGDHGFEVRSPSTKLTSNRAVRNGDLGIGAALGVIDGGGNRASANGDARQCINISCVG